MGRWWGRGWTGFCYGSRVKEEGVRACFWTEIGRACTFVGDDGETGGPDDVAALCLLT